MIGAAHGGGHDANGGQCGLRPAASSYPLTARSTTPPTRWERCSFHILATFAEFEVDLLRTRTREGMAVARAKGYLKGRKPKLTTKQQTELRRMHGTGRLHHHRPRRTDQHLPTDRLPHPRSRGNCCCATQPPTTPRPPLHLGQHQDPPNADARSKRAAAHRSRRSCLVLGQSRIPAATHRTHRRRATSGPSEQREARATVVRPGLGFTCRSSTQQSIPQ
jgi:hypothetical protein